MKNKQNSPKQETTFESQMYGNLVIKIANLELQNSQLTIVNQELQNKLNELEKKPVEK